MKVPSVPAFTPAIFFSSSSLVATGSSTFMTPPAPGSGTRLPQFFAHRVKIAVQQFSAKLPAEHERFLFLGRQRRPEMLRYVVFDVFQMFLMRVLSSPGTLPASTRNFSSMARAFGRRRFEPLQK